MSAVCPCTFIALPMLMLLLLLLVAAGR